MESASACFSNRLASLLKSKSWQQIRDDYPCYFLPPPEKAVLQMEAPVESGAIPNFEDSSQRNQRWRQAPYRVRPQAHTPAFFELTTKASDCKTVKKLPVIPGATYVFDRAYASHSGQR